MAKFDSASFNVGIASGRQRDEIVVEPEIDGGAGDKVVEEVSDIGQCDIAGPVDDEAEVYAQGDKREKRDGLK